MWDYTEKVKEHFLHPRNVGEIEDANAVGEVGSLACGDALKLMLRVDDNGRIVDVKFKTFGCASAIASASALTELVKGRTIDEAQRITNRDIAEYLGGLPEAKMHCSVMGREALEAAIENYRSGLPVRHELEGRVVCSCFGVTEKEIERVVRENKLATVEQVTHYCKAGGGCGNCRRDIAAIIERVRGEAPPDEIQPAVKKPRKPLTNIQRIRLIERTLDQEIRPALQADGGDIELIDVVGPRVLVALRGMCAKCQVSQFTLAEVVQSRLREFVSDDIIVEEQKQ
jgi:NifU-like protein